jgi:hypothetical protein
VFTEAESIPVMLDVNTQKGVYGSQYCEPNGCSIPKEMVDLLCFRKSDTVLVAS